MDATPYEWIPGELRHLHLAVDDAPGRITGAWFDTQETLDGYYHGFHQILSTYGIPFKFLTDKRTVFTCKKKGSPSLDEDPYTQFAYACKQLGVELETTSVPQAKGRVERLTYYRLLDRTGRPVHYRKGTKLMVIRACDGKLFCSVHDTEVYVLKIVLSHMNQSKNFDSDSSDPHPRKQSIPPMSHPWKRDSFRSFVAKQTHHFAQTSLS